MILAVVAITSISNSNIIKHAQNARDNYSIEDEKEKVSLAVHEAMLDGKGKITEDGITKGMETYFGEEGLNWRKVSSDDANVIIVEIGKKENTNNRKYKITLSTGTVEKVTEGTTSGGETGEDNPGSEDGEFLTIQEAQSDEMLSKTTNSKVKDENNNIIVVPAGFKITNDADHVTQGIVITDGTETDGNEFVWIPVGTINKIGGGTETVTLNRYTFADGTTSDTKGTPIPQGENVIDGLYQEVDQATADATNSNMLVAQDISAFKASANTNHGYYIGRYEARHYNSEYTELEKIKINRNYFIGGGIEQNEAANNCRSLYSGKPFVSDLTNSYAWDTAIVFVQKFDDRTDKSVPYSYKTTKYIQDDNADASLLMKISFNGTAHNGNNNEVTEDKICNIFDMAESMYEWTTEHSSYVDEKGEMYSRVVRGGRLNKSDVFTAHREKYENKYDDDAISYRPILYIT